MFSGDLYVKKFLLNGCFYNSIILQMKFKEFIFKQRISAEYFKSENFNLIILSIKIDRQLQIAFFS
ncbi:hypothetical protein BpHYR1_026445 [Brachionus plicatilis]|uniref:Uncharacterized protein n=1 Tax=Brachionus plicatilis TaxID=10195 RepID=A0A3M7S820_BRAPC|nr:hypothetical protein BpHYR1_026445 [Brachionus plicatilis]